MVLVKLIACKTIQKIYIYHKTQVQVDQRLHHKTDTLNLIEEKVGNSLEFIGIGKDFLNRTPLAQTLRSTINGTSQN